MWIRGVTIFIPEDGLVPSRAVSSKDLKNSSRQSGYPELSSSTAPI